LKNLDSFLVKTIHKLPQGARLAAISFHSLEDRIIKHTLAELAAGTDSHPVVKILTKKPVVPAAEEISLNFRARSAKLRAAERI